LAVVEALAVAEALAVEEAALSVSAEVFLYL
jgi:hypothetical protein